MLKFSLIFFIFVQFSSSLNSNIPLNSTSNECLQQYAKLNPFLKVKFLDASGEFPKGVMNGNFHDLGFYDECLSIEDVPNKIYGKYCLGHPSMNADLKRKIGDNLDLDAFPIALLENVLDVGICIPDKCTSDDILKYSHLKFDEKTCSTRFTNNELDTKAMIALIIIYALLFVVLLSTFYDFYIKHNNHKPIHDILIAFSVYTNGKKILKTTNRNDQLECLNGFKAISMMWVVLGHVYINAMFPFVATTMIDNFFDIFRWKNQVVNMFILSAPLSVDTFFTIGGLLTVYVYMKSSENLTIGNLHKVPLMYLHRYLRLTPAFAMMILIYATGLFKYVGNGPKWSQLDSVESTCSDYWWSALLYIQNYMGSSKMCIAQSWYLSVDFQLFLVTPFVLIPLKKYPKYTISALYFLIVIGIIIPFCIGYTNNLTGIGFGMLTSSFGNYYFSTHTRFAPYVIGMIAGYYVFELKKDQENNSLSLNARLKFIVWILCIFVLLVCIFDGYGFVKNQKFPTFKSTDSEFLSGLYLGFNRSIWSCAISVIIILCTTGNGGVINEFLALPIFQILSKLSYSMYLVHYLVIIVVNSSIRTTWHFNNFAIFLQFFAYLILTIVSASFLCLICESPMITVEKIIFPTRRKVTDSHRQTQNNIKV